MDKHVQTHAFWLVLDHYVVLSDDVNISLMIKLILKWWQTILLSLSHSQLLPLSFPCILPLLSALLPSFLFPPPQFSVSFSQNFLSSPVLFEVLSANKPLLML